MVLYAKCELASGIVGSRTCESSLEKCVKYADAGGDALVRGGGSVAERFVKVCRE